MCPGGVPSGEPTTHLGGDLQGGVWTTPQKTRFRDVKRARILDAD